MWYFKENENCNTLLYDLVKIFCRELEIYIYIYFITLSSQWDATITSLSAPTHPYNLFNKVIFPKFQHLDQAFFFLYPPMLFAENTGLCTTTVE